MLFVISAPSGAGKTTIIRELLKVNPLLKFSVSATTRKRRHGEVEGKDYYFLSDKEFDKKLKNDEFAETETVHENRYGTLKREIEKHLTGKEHLIFDIDVNGALSLKKLYPDAILIYIDVPVNQLLNRLKNRKTESEEQIKKRSARIELELRQKVFFDYVVDNSDKPEEQRTAVKAVNKIINKYN